MPHNQPIKRDVMKRSLKQSGHFTFERVEIDEEGGYTSVTIFCTDPMTISVMPPYNYWQTPPEWRDELQQALTECSFSLQTPSKPSS